jgi:hypothetical protein
MNDLQGGGGVSHPYDLHYYRQPPEWKLKQAKFPGNINATFYSVMTFFYYFHASNKQLFFTYHCTEVVQKANLIVDSKSCALKHSWTVLPSLKRRKEAVSWKDILI